MNGVGEKGKKNLSEEENERTNDEAVRSLGFFFLSSP